MLPVNLKDRRRFLKFLAASPLAALPAEAWQAPAASGVDSAAPNYFVPLKDPKDAFSVMDFEDAARRTLPEAHFGYMASGVDDDLTLKANREGFQHIELRTRRLIDVSKVDTRVELFGTTYDYPIFICPTGAQRMFHPDAELATARAAKAKGALQILSTVTSVSYEDIAKARGGPVWYQLYAPAKWEQAEHIIKRVEAAGCRRLRLRSICWADAIRKRTIARAAPIRGRARNATTARPAPIFPPVPCSRGWI
jgi:4-hydroxymandelate oxidase